MRALARQYQALSSDLDELRGHLGTLAHEANPALREARGVGTDVASILLIAAGDNPERLTSEAALAALCGASPIEASSGKTVRHRPNQGGSRQANHALWRIALGPGPTPEPRRAGGKSTRAIIRCPERYIAREIYRLLTTDLQRPAPPPVTPHHRRRRPGHLARPHQRARTRHHAQRRTRTPPLARTRRCLTTDRSISELVMGTGLGRRRGARSRPTPGRPRPSGGRGRPSCRSPRRRWPTAPQG
ncbi:MAG: transposase, partial [Acidimicrobiales bacterium]